MNKDSNSLISIFLTSLSAYNDGFLLGEWVHLPVTKREYKAILQRIAYRDDDELVISDYDLYIDARFGEYENINLLNYLAYRLDELNDYQVTKFDAILQLESLSLIDMINATYNLDCYDFYDDISNDYNLGYYWVEEAGIYDTKNLGPLILYIDHERYGRDIRIEECGMFTDAGYICRNGDIEQSIFTSINDIPADLRL